MTHSMGSGSCDVMSARYAGAYGGKGQKNSDYRRKTNAPCRHRASRYIASLNRV